MTPNPTDCCPGFLTCCCPNRIPESLTASFYSGPFQEDNCESGTGQGAFAITNPGSGVWSGSGTVAGLAASLTMECVDFGGGNCYLAVSVDCGFGGQGLTQLYMECDPFEYVCNSINMCGDATCVVITEDQS